MKKSERYQAIRARASRAIEDLYHNATLPYVRDMYGRTEDYAQSWIADTAQWEIEYIASGGAYGHDYRKTLQAPCNAGKYHSDAAQRRYVNHGMRAMQDEREDCGALTGWGVLELAAGNKRLARKLRKVYGSIPKARHNSRWEEITEYGKLYQWGRGGRTLAPLDLVQQRGGGSFSLKGDLADELPIAAVVRLIQIVESFNAHVTAWCASVPDQWREHCEAEDAEELAAKRRLAAAKRKETIERKHWEYRGEVTA